MVLSPMSRSSLLSKDPQLAAVVKDQLLPTKLFNESVSHSSLVSLGEKLELSSSQRVRYNASVFKLTDSIQHWQPVSRFYVSGSYGRRVTIGSTEIDLVVFLRTADHLPPYAKSNDDLLPKLHYYLKSEFAHTSDVTVSPFMSAGCYLGDSKRPRVCRSKGKDSQHSCCEQHVSVQVEDAKFRIFVAPALGKTSEEQRQASYRRMQEAYTRKGMEGLIGWDPALIEKPSEAMAKETPDVQAFVRVCQYWIQTNQIQSMERYAVETLAFLVAKKMRTEAAQQHSSNSHDASTTSSSSSTFMHDDLHSLLNNTNNDIWTFDLLEAFKRFLSYCVQLRSVRRLCEIESPATYISPFINYSSEIPFLTDNFNPYCNLLESITIHDQEQLSASARCTLNHLAVAASGRSPVTLEQIFAATPRIPSSNKSTFGSRLLFISMFLSVIVAMYAGNLCQRYNWDIPTVQTNMKDGINDDMAWLGQQLQVLWLVLQQWYELISQSVIEKLKQLQLW